MGKMKAANFEEILFKYKFIILGAFFSVLGLIVFRDFLFSRGTLGHHWDWNVPPLSSYLQHMSGTAFFGWSERSLGHARYSFPNFYVFIFNSFGYLGLSGDFVSKFWPFFVVVLSGVGMFYLIEDVLIQEFSAKRGYTVFFPSLLAGYFYSLSPFLFNEFIGGSLFFAYAFMPLPVYLFRKLSRSESKFKHIFALAIVLFLISCMIQFLILILAVLLAYALFKPKRLESIKNLAKSCGIFGLLNAAWFVQASWYVLGYTGTSISEQVVIPWLTDNVSSISEIFIDTGYFVPFFTTSIAPGIRNVWLFCSFGMIILVFTSLFLISKRKSKESLFWSVLLLLSFIPATGGRQPFGGLTVWLYMHVPGMQLFRTPQHLIILPTIFLSILLGMGIFSLTSFSKSHLLLFLPTILITVWLWPFFQPNWGADYLRSHGYNVLDNYRLSPGYEQVLDYLSGQSEDFKVLFLPMAASPHFLGTEYQRVGQGSDPIVVNSLHFVITSDFPVHPHEEQYCDLLDKLFSESSTPETASRLLALANVKYIVVRKDVQPAFGPYARAFDWSQASDTLKQIDGIELVEDHKYVSLWENRYFLPHIYSVSSVLLVNGDVGEMSIVVASDDFTLDKSAIFLTNDFIESKRSLLKSTTTLFSLVKKLWLKPRYMMERKSLLAGQL